MRVGFLNNQIDNRGTGNALFDYAYYNQTLLNNESVIFTFTQGSSDSLMEKRLTDTFGGVHNIQDAFGEDGYQAFRLDVLYHIKYGNDSINSISLPNCRYVVHAVFDVSNPHGDRFAAVSPWLASQAKKKIPYVPHIVNGRHNELTGFTSLRERLGIPPDATVFGRHGGPDTFDIPWVWDAITDAINYDPNLYFIFLGTNVPKNLTDFYTGRIISLPVTSVYQDIFDFVHSCDAMLHARSRGETFGLACSEFDTKPILTYGLSPERAHFDLIRKPVLYFSQEGLTDILLNFPIIRDVQPRREHGYEQFTPEATMKVFDEVFLK